MPVQAFVDESGGDGHTPYFVMAALVSESESWAEFSDEWRFYLSVTPAIGRLKMSEAARCRGEFNGFTETQRDQKLKALASVINRHARFVTYSIIDLAAHAETWKTHLHNPLNEAYFFPFHNTIMAIAFDLWELGLRERFEIIFDENVIFGTRAKIWYPVIMDCFKKLHPDVAAIVPVEPTFKNDDEFLPLQAADLYAGCFRIGITAPEKKQFEWLLQYLKSVKASPHAQLYDKERMENVYSQSFHLPADIMPDQETITASRKIVGWDKD